LKAFLLQIAHTLEAFLLPFGAWGLAAIAFFDSAFLPLPHAIDVWVITLCIKNPSAMLLYASVATLGSIAGCLVLYYVARRGGHAAAERKVGKERMARIRAWFERYEFLTVMVPAILPPPTPFKAFIITAGVVEVGLWKFLLALSIGRTIRYFSEAFLAVHFGMPAWNFMLGKGPLLMGLFMVVFAAVWLVKRLTLGRSPAGAGEPALAPVATAIGPLGSHPVSAPDFSLLAADDGHAHPGGLETPPQPGPDRTSPSFRV